MSHINSPQKIVPFQKIIDAKIASLSGESTKDIAKKTGIRKAILDDRIERIDNILESDLPALSVERRIISEALSEKLKPIKEELSLTSLNIIREADKLTLERLLNADPDTKLSDILKASTDHSARLARITGMEQDPNAAILGQKTDRIKNVNVFIQNILKVHNDKLNSERKKINDINTKLPLDND